MRVVLAKLADSPAWLTLAAEVEFLFGPMVADPGFPAALEQNIARQTAFCMREQDGAPGRPLMGGLLFSATHTPHYTIGWFAVAQRWQRQGVAQLLVQHCIQRIQPPAELSVVTFGEDNRAGRPARHFYYGLSGGRGGAAWPRRWHAPGLPAAAQGIAYGRCADARATPDITARLDQALAGIRAVLGDGLIERAYLEACGQELHARLQALPKAPPAYGIIHGDAIRANALVGDDGSVTVIDFDWYGLGWRAYDIASYLLTIRGSADEQPFAEAFLAGYRAVRSLAEAEYALLPLFEAVRALLEIGTPALHVNLWGSAYLESFFTQSLNRLNRAMQQLTEREIGCR
jgi:GNAT superfamily N-acetyltransferase